METATQPTQPDYSYQADLIRDVWGHLEAAGRCVLAAGCGAGKTRMATELIVKWLDANPGGRVLVLAHGQRVLREQFADALAAAKHPYTVTEVGRGAFDTDAHIHVALPQARRHYLDLQYGLIVVDEAHEFYTGGMVKSIVEANPEAKQLLLTASHWYYTKQNTEKLTKWPVVYFSQLEMFERGVLMQPRSSLILTDDDFRVGLNTQGNLREDYELSRVEQTTVDAISRLRKEGGLGRKMLVACHNVTASRQVAAVLNANEIKAALSVAEDDGDSSELHKFQTRPDIRACVVVYRGILGLDMPELDTVLDLTGTQNVNRIYQLLGRVVRRGNKAVEPKYLKLAPRANEDWYLHVMCGVTMLAEPETYRSFKGRLDSLRVPTPKGYTPRDIITHRSGELAVARQVRRVPMWMGLAVIKEMAERGEGGWQLPSLDQIRGAFNGCDPEGKKAELLELAKSGADRPNSRTAELGPDLHRYTCSSHACYSPDFDAEIRVLRPDWFLGSSVKPVMCIEDGRLFLSTKQAAEAVGIYPSNITTCLRERAETAGGYTWRYATPEEIRRYFEEAKSNGGFTSKSKTNTIEE